jgi:hypothetical protein
MDVKIRFRKEGNKLIYHDYGGEELYKDFKDIVPEGKIVEAFFDVKKDDGTNGQLAKLHKTIRDVAYHTGFGFEELKLLTKKRAGLCIPYTLDGEKVLDCKSFADCSYEELSLAIQAAQEMGVQSGMLQI